MSNLNQNKNQNQTFNEFLQILNTLPSEKRINYYYTSIIKDPRVFDELWNNIFNPDYVIKTKEEANRMSEYISALCKIYNETNYREYGDLIAKMIDLLFNFPNRLDLYLTQLLESSQNNKICKNFNYILVKKMFTKQLEIQENYKTQFYNTNIPNKKPFITVLIMGHGFDLTNLLPINENTNTLMFNFSSVPNVVTKLFNDKLFETTMDYLTNIVNNKPNKYIDIINNLTELKETYISNVKNMADNNDKSDQLAKKYADYACRVTKPIKDKGYTFTGILNPGIYIIAGVDLNLKVDTNEANSYNRLINLLIPEDLMFFNELFGKEQDYGANIFYNPFNNFYQTHGFPITVINQNVYIQLQNINSYFNHLGIENVGYIDVSCRESIEKKPINIPRQMVIEEMGASNKCGQFPVFGGFSKGLNNKKKSKKNKSKKNNKNIKNK